jgi:drug/metabolite transporter (DMT)-like permease
MNTQNLTPNKTSPNGAGLLVMGILSIFLGPFIAIPGVVISHRFRPFTPSAYVGYVLCWIFSVVPVLFLLLFLLHKKT